VGVLLEGRFFRLGLKLLEELRILVGALLDILPGKEFVVAGGNTLEAEDPCWSVVISLNRE
jgi:hypothetical protein